MIMMIKNVTNSEISSELLDHKISSNRRNLRISAFSFCSFFPGVRENFEANFLTFWNKYLCFS